MTACHPVAKEQVQNKWAKHQEGLPDSVTSSCHGFCPGGVPATHGSDWTPLTPTAEDPGPLASWPAHQGTEWELFSDATLLSHFSGMPRS